MPEYSLAIHGGAGTILRSEMTAEKEESHQKALLAALQAGEALLKAGRSALDAVETVVRSLEDCEYFNAGKGAVFTHEGNNEMDASIMCGKTLKAGAVAMVQGVKNPISLARRILEASDHVLLCGPGALEFAREQGIEEALPDYFYSEFRQRQLQAARARGKAQLDHSQKHGTVGAVACDRHGHLAAATSTGGLTNKQYGRVGDSPIIGAGTYANDLTCAVSCTGYGEYFIRGVVAYDVSCLMEYRGLSLEEAARHAIHHRQLALGGDGGLIAVDAKGHIALPFNSEGMYRAWVREGEEVGVKIYKD
ncbi:MAG: isoaspartyl peptidase/L-asparaginase [Lewinellaceae bacterium]|nr:isoaspartyl peptidase/L-asparaginase [Phaeodactylibacter sp.]MCB9036480.1 isoaspartyl peptidase/L-asparaginase [Lewinellaceae bacterium]